MGIFDSFLNPQPAPAAAPAPGTPIAAPTTGIPAPGTNGVPAAPIEPVVGDPAVVVPVVDAAPTEPQSPLDPFKGLWDNPVIDDKNKPAPLVAVIDPKELQKKVEGVDFSAAVTPEVLANISAGGEGAAEALTTALNIVAQNVMTHATLVNNKLMEQAVERTKEQTLAGIPDLIRTQTLANNLSTDNPLFNNPAIKPLLDMAQSQFAVKFPDANANELTKMSQDYIAAVVQTLTPAAPKDTNPLDGSGESDFSNFLNPIQPMSGS